MWPCPNPGELDHVGPNLRGAAAAVEPHRERPGVRDGRVEGVEGLARKNATALVGDGARHHDGQAQLLVGEDVLDGAQARLERQRVDDGLGQQQVAAAVDEAAHLLGVGVAHFIEGDRAEAGIGDPRRERQRLVGRAHGARHQARAFGRARGPRIGGPARDLRGRDVQLVDHGFKLVVGLGDARGAEAVGLDDVRAGLQVGAVDLLHHGRPGEHEDVVVAAQLVAVLGETLAAEVRLAELVALDHGTHGAVDDEDALDECGV